MRILIIIICIVMSYQDINKRMIYSPLNSILLIIGFFNNYVNIKQKILGIILLPISLLLINKYYKEIIGEGDIEFISAAGALLGYYYQNIMLIISCLIATIYMLITKKRIIPMIPFLTIGLLICLTINRIY